jgi:hypothetical protein
MLQSARGGRKAYPIKAVMLRHGRRLRSAWHPPRPPRPKHRPRSSIKIGQPHHDSQSGNRSPFPEQDPPLSPAKCWSGFEAGRRSIPRNESVGWAKAPFAPCPPRPVGTIGVLIPPVGTAQERLFPPYRIRRRSRRDMIRSKNSLVWIDGTAAARATPLLTLRMRGNSNAGVSLQGSFRHRPSHRRHEKNHECSEPCRPPIAAE